MDEKRYKEIKSRDMEWHLRKKPLTEWKNYSVIQVNLNSGSSDGGERHFLISQICSQQMKCWCAFSLWECTGPHPVCPAMVSPPQLINDTTATKKSSLCSASCFSNRIS